MVVTESGGLEEEGKALQRGTCCAELKGGGTGRRELGDISPWERRA